jgi:putative NADPH-quinone reductase
MSAPYPDDALSAMRNADVIVMAFPLFVYSLPGALVRLLEDYWICFRNAGDRHTAARMYAIVNCAFTEPEINEDAIRVVKSFCRKLGITWRFAVSIGCGPLFQNQS